MSKHTFCEGRARATCAPPPQLIDSPLKCNCCLGKLDVPQGDIHLRFYDLLVKQGGHGCFINNYEKRTIQMVNVFFQNYEYSIDFAAPLENRALAFHYSCLMRSSSDNNFPTINERKSLVYTFGKLVVISLHMLQFPQQPLGNVNNSSDTSLSETISTTIIPESYYVMNIQSVFHKDLKRQAEFQGEINSFSFQTPSHTKR